MTRPHRIEFAGATYHVTSRGDRHEQIFTDDKDCSCLLAVISHSMFRLDAELLAFCLMGNHYHLVLRTRQANLSRLMRHVNGEYTRAFNKRHDLAGHLFQGRFKAILVDSDSYLMELCRYVELNPVRAGLVRSVGEWQWSSYRAHTGQESSPKWLATRPLHDHLLGHDALTAEDHAAAAHLYEQLVADGLDVDLWGKHLRHKIFLGNDRFVANMQLLADPQRAGCAEIPRIERERPVTLADWILSGNDENESIRLAYSDGGMTMSAIARQAGVSIATISRIISRAERTGGVGFVEEAGDAKPGTLQDLAPCKT